MNSPGMTEKYKQFIAQLKINLQSFKSTSKEYNKTAF